MVAEMLQVFVYSEEVWVNIAKSITMAEEQLSSFIDLSEITIKLLIRQTRRDLFFYEKCK